MAVPWAGLTVCCLAEYLAGEKAAYLVENSAG